MGRVVVFGNASLDIVLSLRAFPEPGETVLARAAMTCAGGKGLNQAVAAARTGASVHLIAALGRDAAATTVRAAVAQEAGLAARFLVRDLPTDVSTIWVDASGENVIASANLAAHSLRPADAAAELDDIRSDDWLLLQGNLERDATEAAMRAAHSAGARVILNSAPMQPWIRDLLPGIDVLVANEVEARQIAGRDGAAAEALLEAGAGTVIVTRGAAGASRRSPEGATEIAAPMVTCVDASGAGDVFVGTLSGLVSQGVDTMESVACAVSAASLSVTRRGTTPSFPSRAEIEALRVRPAAETAR